jgi:hypothetical protein
MDDKISIRLKRSPVENYNIISEYFEDRVDSGKLNNNSRINYLNSIKKLNNIVGGEVGKFDVDLFINNIDLLHDYFNDSNKTKTNLLKTLLMCFKIVNVKIPKVLRDLKIKNSDQISEAIQEEPKKKLPYNNFDEIVKEYNKETKDINKLLHSLSDNHTMSIIKFIAMSIYTLVPPLRPSEWLSLKVYMNANSNKPTGNYLDLSNGKIFYTDYKTKRHYSDLEFQLDKQLVSIIKKYYSYLNKIDDKDNYVYLFTNQDGSNIMQQSNFSKLIKSIPIFKDMCPNDLRNLYVSSLEHRSMEERAIIASFMKHSLGTQMTIYSKYDNVLHPDK